MFKNWFYSSKTNFENWKKKRKSSSILKNFGKAGMPFVLEVKEDGHNNAN